jgi:hypothetical protein
MSNLSLFDVFAVESEQAPAIRMLPAPAVPTPVASVSVPEAPQLELIKFTDREPERDFIWVFQGHYGRPDTCEPTTMEEYRQYRKHQGVPAGSHWMY